MSDFSISHITRKTTELTTKALCTNAFFSGTNSNIIHPAQNTNHLGYITIGNSSRNLLKMIVLKNVKYEVGVYFTTKYREIQNNQNQRLYQAPNQFHQQTYHLKFQPYYLNR